MFGAVGPMCLKKMRWTKHPSTGSPGLATVVGVREPVAVAGSGFPVVSVLFACVSVRRSAHFSTTEVAYRIALLLSHEHHHFTSCASSVLNLLLLLLSMLQQQQQQGGSRHGPVHLSSLVTGSEARAGRISIAVATADP